MSATLASPVSCFGGNDGQALGAATGGNGVYSYLWSDGQTTALATGLPAGVHSVVISDSSGCADIDSVLIPSPTAVQLSASALTQVSCFGNADGSALANATGGTGTFTYLWSNGQTGASATGLAAGSYTVVATDSLGCSDSATVTITAPASLNATLSITAGVSCFGGNDGAASLSIGGGSGPFSYLWSTGDTTAAVTGLPAGPISVVVTDGNGCQESDSVILQAPTPLLSTISPGAAISCAGGNNGTLLGSATGGAGGYQYVWSNGQSGPTATGLSTGPATLVVTDANGCQDSSTFVVADPTAIQVTANLLAGITCFGGNDGSASVLASGGVGGFTYLWSDGQTGPTALGLAAGNYSVVATDANGCMDSATIVLTSPADLQLTTSVVNMATCTGLNDGTATIAATGGTSPYTYLWSNGQTGTVASGLSAGQYSVVVTDGAGCVDSASVLMSQPGTIGISFQVLQPVSCVGTTDGVVLATAVGGAGGYSFLWSKGDTTNFLSGVGEGVYVLTVTDSLGCTGMDSLTLTAPSLLQAVVDIISLITCPNGSDGSLQAVSIGGVAPFSYAWSTGGTSDIEAGLIAGTYGVEITDANGCKAVASETLLPPVGINVQIQVVDSISCFGETDGSLQANISGGNAPYSITWSTGAITNGLSGIGSGSYGLYVVDAIGCTDTATVTLLEPDSIQVSVSILNPVQCFGVDDGALLAVGVGGAGPLSYYWDNFANTDTAINLSPGQYIVTVIDPNGCFVEDSILLPAPPAIQVSILSQTDVSCFGASDGAVDVSVSGGNGALAFSWSNGSVGTPISGLSAGSYVLTVTDAIGCQMNDTIDILSPSALQVGVQVLNLVGCTGISDGEITAQVSGGTSPYSYLWSTGATDSTLDGLAPGTYAVVVTDAKGCSATDSLVLTPGVPIQATLSGVVGPGCSSNNTGSATVTAVGGAGTYTYLWSNGVTTATVNNLSAGPFWVKVMDAGGCSDSIASVLIQADSLQASIQLTQPILCAGDQNGQISLAISGGTPGYSYLWNQGATSDTLSGLGVGSYSVVVTDASGCTDTASIQLSSPAPLQVSTIVSQPISCPADTDGEAAAVTVGGTGPYQFLWSDGQTTAIASNLGAATYTVTVTDANGCSLSNTVTLILPTLLQASIQVQQPISCVGDEDGILSVSVVGGVASYNYLWSNGLTGTAINNLGAGTYQVFVEDGNGCQDTASFVLNEPDSLIVQASILQEIVCAGVDDAILIGNVTGGTPGFQLVWTPGGIFDTLQSVGPGSYSLQVTDSSGCVASDTILVVAPPSIQIDFEILAEITCFGGANGQIAVSASGGAAPYQWQWNDSTLGDTISQLVAGTYTAFLTDSLQCVDSVVVVLQEPDAMTLDLDLLVAASCDSAANGQGSVTVTGGTAPYQFVWMNGEVADTAFMLAPGWQEIQVTDSLGCFVGDSLLVETQLPWSAQVVVVDTVTCFGGADGMAEVELSVAETGFIFLWNNGEAGNPAIALSTDSTLVTVTDSNGCDTTLLVFVPGPLAIEVEAQVAASDPGAANGAIRIDQVLHGVGPFNYNWTNGETGTTLISLDTGLYQVLVTDSRGCEGVGSFVIGENALDWSNFEADLSCELGLVTVDWDVTEERGVDFYSLERSDDGLVYSRVAEMASLGDTLGLRTYSLLDSVTPEEIFRYRIRAHYANGSTSATEPLIVEGCATDSGYVIVYPVPVLTGEEFTVVIRTRTPNRTRVEFRNALHQTLQFYEIDNPIGRQELIFQSEGLAGGHYYIVVSNLEEGYGARVLVYE